MAYFPCLVLVVLSLCEVPGDFFVFDDVQMNFVAGVLDSAQLFHRLVDLVLNHIVFHNLVSGLPEIYRRKGHGQDRLALRAFADRFCC